ncbi:O-antigen ligase family protein [Caldisalinibacter kiritimatiensis]|uniref:O-antigen polymerase n=1 Tax=Caldisalinibacter kiritimatiensis TaxID=1304284 RepID=R1CS65_9FIRM|nr:O-antigen ligase family protein [Caldisalinibacter kiritimatiensis]EOC99538.1 O-antigen polymerase [Caldisalinibacter kiritimatiensis]
MHESLTLNFIIKLWRYTERCYKRSLINRVLYRIYSIFMFLLRGSLIFNFLTKDKSVIENSFVYKVYEYVVDLSKNLIDLIRKIIKKYMKYSFVYKLVHSISKIQIYTIRIIKGSWFTKFLDYIFNVDKMEGQQTFNLNLGILAAIIILPFAPKIISLLFIAFVVFTFFIKLLYKEDYFLRKSFVDIPILLLAIVFIITTITSYNLQGSLRDLVIHIIAISFIYVIVNSIKTENQLNAILTTTVFTATIVALYGLYQYKVGVKVDDAWVDVANNPDLKTRVFSVFGNPNILAEYLIMITPISLSLFWVTKKIFKKIVFLATTLILIATLIFTFSRGGWLGFAFGIFVFVILVEKKLLISLIPAGLLSIFIMPSAIINRILTIGNLRDSSNAYRIKVWDITLDIIRDNWVSGVGFGYIPFKETYVKYIRTMNVYHAHNTYLETLAEVGIGGFIIFIIMLFIIYKYSLMSYRKTDNKYLKVITAGLLASLSSILFHGLVENILYLPRIIITFWTIISFILVILNISSKENRVT